MTTYKHLYGALWVSGPPDDQFVDDGCVSETNVCCWTGSGAELGRDCETAHLWRLLSERPIVHQCAAYLHSTGTTTHCSVSCAIHVQKLCS